MSDTGFCACNAVMFDPVRHEDGTRSERWRCVDCRAEFRRSSSLSRRGMGAITSAAVDAALKEEP